MDKKVKVFNLNDSDVEKKLLNFMDALEEVNAKAISKYALPGERIITVMTEELRCPVCTYHLYRVLQISEDNYKNNYPHVHKKWSNFNEIDFWSCLKCLSIIAKKDLQIELLVNASDEEDNPNMYL